MTLVLAVHNGKDIVVGSDTLARVTNILTGETTNIYDFRKIFPIGEHSALLLAGFFDTQQVTTFMNYFVARRVSANDDVDSIKQKFWNDICSLLPMDRGDAIEVVIAGFTVEGAPKLYCVKKDHKEASEFTPILDYYEAAGNDAPRLRAQELLNGANALDTPQLEKLIGQTIEKCITEFPDKLGGKSDILTLKYK